MGFSIGAARGAGQSPAKKSSGGGGGGGPAQPQPEQVDPRIKAMQERQIKAAQDFRAGAEGMKDQRIGQAQEGIRGELAQNLAQVKRNVNNRGMLYSGLNQQAQMQAQGAAQAQAAAQRAQINQDVENQANALEGAALGNAAAVNQAQNSFNQAAYNQALQERQARGSALAALGGGLGSLAGSYLGSK